MTTISSVISSVIEKAIETYGADLQKQVAIEEMSELIKEICKDFRGKGNRDNILEELADVIIMTTQLQIIYGIRFGEMSNKIEEKIGRLSERLKGE